MLNVKCLGVWSPYLETKIHDSIIVPLPSAGMLLPLPGESVESCALELGATSKTVGSSMAQLLTAANQGKVCVSAYICTCMCVRTFFHMYA